MIEDAKACKEEDNRQPRSTAIDRGQGKRADMARPLPRLRKSPRERFARHDRTHTHARTHAFLRDKTPDITPNTLQIEIANIYQLFALCINPFEPQFLLQENRKDLMIYYIFKYKFIDKFIYDSYNDI